MARRFGFLIGAVILLQNYLNQVSGIPTPASTTTNNVSSSTSGYLKFNIDPDIISKRLIKTRSLECWLRYQDD